MAYRDSLSSYHSEKLHTLPEHARKAAEELLALDAPVYHAGQGESGAHFVLGGELRDDNDSYWADYYQEELVESMGDNGVILNAFGIRTQVHDILRKHGLFAEWINAGMVGIYDA